MKRLICAILLSLCTVLLCAAAGAGGTLTVHLQDDSGTVRLYRVQLSAEADLYSPETAAAAASHITERIPLAELHAKNGEVTFSGLPDGTYLVVHTDAAFSPFLVRIPMESYGNRAFQISARPKQLQPEESPDTPFTGESGLPALLLSLQLFSLCGIGITFLHKRRSV